MKKLFATFMVFALVLSAALPLGTVNKAEAKSNEESFNVKRYGNILDIGPKLRAQAENEEFRQQLKEKLKAQAEQINADGSSQDGQAAKAENFTFSGGTKYFLGYDTVNGYYIKQYTLRSVGENVEVWVANDMSYPDDRQDPNINQEMVDNLVKEFDQNIYAKEKEFFGKPDVHTGKSATLDDILGVAEDYYTSDDGSHRVMLLIDNFRDSAYYNSDYPFYVAGFYSSVYEDYFDRNIVNLDPQVMNSEGHGYGTLAHEFQHLIHDDNDSDETSWINEGMADFAEYLVGYGHPMGHVNYFLDHPENSLVSWDEYLNSPTGPETLADYGQAYLLQLYLNDHFGKEFIKSLIQDPKNGIASINQELSDAGADVTFAELWRNFGTALHVDSPKPGHGKYNFESIDLKINYEAAAKHQKEGVPAWGADYIKLDSTKKVKNVIFDGIQFLPIPWQTVEDPLNEGNQVYWGSNGNLLDNHLIFEADLTNIENATLTFDQYLQIEPTWDYGFVQVSTDGGKTWTSLSNENTTSEVNANAHPNVKGNVPGFTGSVDHWTNQTFDLSNYAGQQILISFRYVTDWASNLAGWYVDNIEIPQIGLSYDGSSLESFSSLPEILGNSVDYAVTFINEKNKKNGKDKYKVLHYNLSNITKAEQLKLKKILARGDNYMVVWFAADEGQKGTVDYNYDLVK